MPRPEGARAVTAWGSRRWAGERGMSHFPEPTGYGSPELAWDQAVLARLATGNNFKSLIGHSEAELDAGRHLGYPSSAAGPATRRARRSAGPTSLQMDPSWHHEYASLA